jgi:hypothetical protein
VLAALEQIVDGLKKVEFGSAVRAAQDVYAKVAAQGG